MSPLSWLRRRPRPSGGAAAPAPDTAPPSRRERLRAASGHLDDAAQLMAEVHESLDLCWESPSPDAYDAAQWRLTRLQHAIGRTRAALASTQRRTP